jgi:UDP-N-acetylglucosamine:LPS N-acetylglucosamine transferase
MSRTILILTSKTGGGHISLAEALRDRLEAKYTIEMVDPQSRFFHWHYRMVSHYALWLWAADFRLSDNPRGALLSHRIFTLTVSKALSALLDRVQPELIITTYPFLTYEVMQVMRRRRSSIPLVMLFADPNGVHASWLTTRDAAATLAPTRETYNQALSVNFPPERLHQVGWPVRDQFYRVQPEQRPALLEQMGLDHNRFTVFLQGGGEGAAQFGRTVERVLTIPQLQVILAAGTNQTLITRFANRPQSNIFVLPFTKEIAPYMAAADVIMGKAGPNMLFESVTLGKPFIATAYIPGQEGTNLEFIRRHKLGWVALEPVQQIALLKKLVSTPQELQIMDASVKAYREWNNQQADRIVPVIEGLLKGCATDFDRVGK